MSKNTTYSFADISAVISHPLVGQKQATGEGIGTLTVSMTDDRTQSQLAADGSTMMSKILSGRGTITLEIQQTSALNIWLVNAYNIIDNAASSAWAGLGINIKELFANGLKIVASGVAFQKLADRKDAQAGDNVTWTLMCAKIVQGAN